MGHKNLTTKLELYDWKGSCISETDHILCKSNRLLTQLCKVANCAVENTTRGNISNAQLPLILKLIIMNFSCGTWRSKVCQGMPSIRQSEQDCYQSDWSKVVQISFYTQIESTWALVPRTDVSHHDFILKFDAQLLVYLLRVNYWNFVL